MLKKIIFFLVLLLVSNLAPSLEAERSYESWTTGILRSQNNGSIYRAISNVERKTSLRAYFAMDLLEDCKTYNPNLIVLFPDGIDNEGKLNKGLFQARVDSRQTITGGWESAANRMGDRHLFVSLYTKLVNQLEEDIKLGKTLRIKIEFRDPNRNNLYFNFSLEGSAASLIRTASLCRSRLSGNDQSYFEKDLL